MKEIDWDYLDSPAGANLRKTITTLGAIVAFAGAAYELVRGGDAGMTVTCAITGAGLLLAGMRTSGHSSSGPHP